MNSVNYCAITPTESISGASLTPYGLPCIRELLRFLITLINPLDKQNTDAMIHMGLSLLTIALEVGADSIGKYDTLLEMMKDDLCRNLFAVSVFPGNDLDEMHLSLECKSVFDWKI